jgi:ABC-type phosphate/phosphonate transport system substrate-binding protein
MRKQLFALLMLLMVPLAHAEPPLRVVVAAEGDGLRVAEFWSSLGASEDGGSGILVDIVPGYRDVEDSLRHRAAEAAVMDPVSFLDYGPGLAVAAVVNYDGKAATRFSLIVSSQSIFNRISDLAAPRMAYRGPDAGVARVVPLAWAKAAGAFSGTGDGSVSELLLDSYESVLRAVAFGVADAGFVPTSLLDDSAGAILLERVRELGSTPPVSVALLVIRDDLSADRAGMVSALSARVVEAGALSPFTAPDAVLEQQLDAIKEAARATAR